MLTKASIDIEMPKKQSRELLRAIESQVFVSDIYYSS